VEELHNNEYNEKAAKQKQHPKRIFNSHKQFSHTVETHYSHFHQHAESPFFPHTHWQNLRQFQVLQRICQ
jgi:hypothetical protein